MIVHTNKRAYGNHHAPAALKVCIRTYVRTVSTVVGLLHTRKFATTVPCRHVVVPLLRPLIVSLARTIWLDNVMGPLQLIIFVVKSITEDVADIDMLTGQLRM